MNFLTELAEVSSYVMVLDTSFRVLVIVEDNKRDVGGREKQLIMLLFNVFLWTKQFLCQRSKKFSQKIWGGGGDIENVTWN